MRWRRERLSALVCPWLLLAGCAAVAFVPFTQQAQAGQWGEKADRVIVYKSQRKLELLRDGQVIKTFPISLGGNPLGTKVRQWDGRTPEGHYMLDAKNPNSKYYLSIHISYPNAHDRKRSRRLGDNPGGAIFIHGLPNHMSKPRSYYLHHDWTLGCIAVSDNAMMWIWQAVQPGTPIDIKP